VNKLYKSQTPLKNMKKLFLAKDAEADDGSPITSVEMKQGWYWWSDKKTKKKGTPDDWAYELEGTRSARWSKKDR
jgi:hypothetical protein